jgi:hypothetical protein
MLVPFSVQTRMQRGRIKAMAFSILQSCGMSHRRPSNFVGLSAGGRSIGEGGWQRPCVCGINSYKTSCARVERLFEDIESSEANICFSGRRDMLWR